MNQLLDIIILVVGYSIVIALYVLVCLQIYKYSLKEGEGYLKSFKIFMSFCPLINFNYWTWLYGRRLAWPTSRLIMMVIVTYCCSWFLVLVALWYDTQKMKAEWRRAEENRKDQDCMLSDNGLTQVTECAEVVALEDDQKICPYCAETIKAKAIKCRYCGSDLTSI